MSEPQEARKLELTGVGKDFRRLFTLIEAVRKGVGVPV